MDTQKNLKNWIVGVDLGGTHIRAILTDRQGHKKARAQHQTRAQEGPQAVIQRILQTIAEVLANTDHQQIAAIGVGVPGPVDPKTGTLYDPPNLPGWTAIPLAQYIMAAYPIPTFVDNDANVAALGEHRFGAGQGVDDMVYITVSTGIGGGIISGGRLIEGAHGFAGEIGHQVLDPNGPWCGCGQRGHMEAFASGTAIARDAQQILRQGTASKMLELAGSVEEVTAKTVTEAAAQGDEVAREILQRAAFYIGLGLVNVLHILEPQRILIGGGVSQAGDLLFQPVRETVRQHVMSKVYHGVEILPAALGADVGLLGAVALALSRLDRDPASAKETR